MSAKKSWDIAPKARPIDSVRVKTPPSRPAVTRSMDMRPRTRQSAPLVVPVPVSKKNVTLARGMKQRAEAKEPLKKRRKKQKKALFIVLGIAFVILSAMMFYAAWMPSLRIKEVRASGPHADEARTLSQAALAGTHAFVLPRNSLFFIPENDIRDRILTAYPDVEAVSLSTDGLNVLMVVMHTRSEAFLWCGEQPLGESDVCYRTNAEGLIFGELDANVASTTEMLKMYGPLVGQEGDSPIRAHISGASRIPDVLRFVKALESLGADVASLVLRDDEADIYTNAGTRITYVLGRELEAAGTAASVFPQLSLNDGSISYVDLRFSGKAYFKRTVATEPVTE